MRKFTLLLAASLCLLSACKEEKPVAPAPVAEAPEEEPTFDQIDVSAWIGTWVGPEGTYLNIEEKEIGYTITIGNLDGPRTFDGDAEGGVIGFTRDGKPQIIQPGTGADTGMKWLADKKNCLVIVGENEGYCRD